MSTVDIYGCFLLVCAYTVRCVVVVFFFQAEDGIRDLVRSRGLGDVYKRQAGDDHRNNFSITAGFNHAGYYFARASAHQTTDQAVSYTHLTLPTSDLV